MATQAKRPRVAGPVDGGDPDPVACFLSWCRRVGLELSPKSELRCRASRAGCHCCWRCSTSCRPRPHAGGPTLRSGPSWAAWSTRCSGTKTEAERLLVYERWDFLCKLEMVGEEGAFVIGREEVLTEEELTTTLKVLCMPAEEFRELKDQDGGGDDKREEGSLTITNIPKLKASWRQLLQNSVLL
ncbi:SETD6 isoform 9, partial [Pan troglodytes]